MSKVIKIIDERETKKKKTTTRGMEAIAKGWEINDFVKSLS